MGGHYDSCVCGVPVSGGLGGGNDGTSDAPEADNDGPGTSAVLELARIGSKRYPKGLTSGDQTWTLAWRAVAGAAAYEVLARPTWSPTYTCLIPVQEASFVLDEQLDGAWAAVRSVGADGARSLTTVFVQAPRAPRPAGSPPLGPSGR